MAQFFFDESIHERGGFILGAFVHAPESVTAAVNAALRRAGLIPGQDEFKSSARMKNAPELARLREELLRVILDHTKIAVLICPAADRHLLWKQSLHALLSIVRANGLEGAHHEVYFDEGVVIHPTRAQELAHELQLSPPCVCHLSANSKSVPGLQLADLVAHTCSMMLLEQMGLVTKMVRAGPNSGYEPDLEFELGWELWARLRYSFFHGGNDCKIDDDPIDCMTVNVSGFGLFTAPSCYDRLRTAADHRFGKCYLGCIH